MKDPPVCAFCHRCPRPPRLALDHRPCAPRRSRRYGANAMEPLLGSIMLFGGNLQPRGWAFCSGQSLGIVPCSAVSSLLGTTYGGDGINTFRLPDLRGRVAVHAGSGVGLSPRSPGEAFGSESVTSGSDQVPPDRHERVVADVSSASDRRQGDMLARSKIHSETSGPTLNPLSITLTEGGQLHGNMQPSLCMNYIIALEGIYPSPH